MPDLGAVLDDGYVPLGGAANSLARRLPGSTAAGFMELFKTALFNGEFDDGPEDFGESGIAWLRTVNEQGALRLHPMQRCQAAARGERPAARPSGGESGIAWLRTVTETSKRRYGFTRCSVVRLLLGANALPPDPAVRQSLFDVIAIMRGEEPGYDILSRTPFDEYPERGRRELEGLMARRSVLASFLRSCCQVSSLAGVGGNRAPVFDVSPANENHILTKRPSHLRGRPRKAAWPRIAELARQLAQDHPDWQRKRLAFEA